MRSGSATQPLHQSAPAAFREAKPVSETHHRRSGFSLVESVVGISLTTIAGAALLTAISASVQTTTFETRSTIGRGLAEQLMEEICSRRFPADAATAQTATTRAEFDDIDDYHGWTESPPATEFGVALGLEGQLAIGREASAPHVRNGRPSALNLDQSFLERFRREVTVERIDRDAGGNWIRVSGDSNYRRVIVSVHFTDAAGEMREVARTQRVLTDASLAP